MNTFQHAFHQQWGTLKDRHVRALAWVLTSPNLLEDSSGVWLDQLDHLRLPQFGHLFEWLHALDEHPSILHEALKLHKFLRLGHYAENLLAYFYSHTGLLYSHGLQVHSPEGETLGEFDYLLFDEFGLQHVELATKFYLFCPTESTKMKPSIFQYLGPQLNDNLGAKMQKIMQKQLTLPQHEAARKLVAQKIVSSKAVVKGWLFYRSTQVMQAAITGIAKDHCMGFWWTLEEFEQLAVHYAMPLERLQWLAPAQTELDEVRDKSMMMEYLQRHFHGDNAPVMVAVMRKNGDCMQEFCRGFVVPNDWPYRAQRVEQGRGAMAFAV